MKKTLLIILIFSLSGCGLYRGDNGLSFFKPYYMKRDILVTKVDLNILDKTDMILTKELWQKKDVIFCKDSQKLTLLCALEKASVYVLGKYNHRQPALQEVRFIIDDIFQSRWDKHRLRDFNSNPKTSFEDIKLVIDKAKETVKIKLQKNVKVP